MAADAAGKLTCTVTQAQAASGPVTVLALVGSAGIVEMDALNLVCNRVAAGHPARTIVDLTGLTFMCSLAIGSLVTLHHGVKTRGGKLELAGADKSISEVLVRTRMHQILKMHPTIEAAMAV